MSEFLAFWAPAKLPVHAQLHEVDNVIDDLVQPAYGEGIIPELLEVFFRVLAEA